MDKIEESLKTFIEHLDQSGISDREIKNLDVVRVLEKSSWKEFKKLFFGIGLVFLMLLTILSFRKDDMCLLDMPQDASKLFREPESCEFCRNVENGIEKIENISSEMFIEEYLLPLRPLLVSGGAADWPAYRAFDFNFFKTLFEIADRDRNDKKSCQFFPYKTGFRSLREAFLLDEDTVLSHSGKKTWYIGWSNCNDDTGRYLRAYYDKPYFLSNMTENLALSWIFMGEAGHGAHMHVDNVHYPSWQAQLRGTKLWLLAPPPECYYQCNQLEVTVNPGDIIVLDTNRWYHQTIVQPGEISISIGAEFD